jgi:hypothetical protein
VAAGLADHADRDVHAGPGDQALVDRGLHPEVGATGVPDRGDPGPERRPQVLHGLVEGEREGCLQVLPLVDVGEQDVSVAVEEARQDRLAGRVDPLVPVQTGPDRDDPAVLDHDIGVGGRRSGSIEDLPATE